MLNGAYNIVQYRFPGLHAGVQPTEKPISDGISFFNSVWVAPDNLYVTSNNNDIYISRSCWIYSMTDEEVASFRGERKFIGIELSLD